MSKLTIGLVCLVAGVAVGLSLNAARYFNGGRRYGYREAAAEYEYEAIRRGYAEATTGVACGKPLQWIVRRHPSQRAMFPNDTFLPSDSTSWDGFLTSLQWRLDQCWPAKMPVTVSEPLNKD